MADAGPEASAAAAVNTDDGYREILGLQVSSGEDGAGWLAFFRDPRRPRPVRRRAGHSDAQGDTHGGIDVA